MAAPKEKKKRKKQEKNNKFFKNWSIKKKQTDRCKWRPQMCRIVCASRHGQYPLFYTQSVPSLFLFCKNWINMITKAT